ncbi:MAG: hypothetical protein WBZ36_09525 [Candidatus Nitrosopolaris sp.]
MFKTTAIDTLKQDKKCQACWYIILSTMSGSTTLRLVLINPQTYRATMSYEVFGSLLLNYLSIDYMFISGTSFKGVILLGISASVLVFGLTLANHAFAQGTSGQSGASGGAGGSGAGGAPGGQSGASGGAGGSGAGGAPGGLGGGGGTGGSGTGGTGHH